jgi:hypothetical protein
MLCNGVGKSAVGMVRWTGYAWRDEKGMCSFGQKTIRKENTS